MWINNSSLAGPVCFTLYIKMYLNDSWNWWFTPIPIYYNVRNKHVFICVLSFFSSSMFLSLSFLLKIRRTRERTYRANIHFCAFGLLSRNHPAVRTWMQRERIFRYACSSCDARGICGLFRLFLFHSKYTTTKYNGG